MDPLSHFSVQLWGQVYFFESSWGFMTNGRLCCAFVKTANQELTFSDLVPWSQADVLQALTGLTFASIDVSLIPHSANIIMNNICPMEDRITDWHGKYSQPDRPILRANPQQPDPNPGVRDRFRLQDLGRALPLQHGMQAPVWPSVAAPYSSGANAQTDALQPGIVGTPTQYGMPLAVGHHPATGYPTHQSVSQTGQAVVGYPPQQSRIRRRHEEDIQRHHGHVHERDAYGHGG